MTLENSKKLHAHYLSMGAVENAKELEVLYPTLAGNSEEPKKVKTKKSE